MVKKALIIGINYTNNWTIRSLKGCINDALLCERTLIEIHGFPSENIVTMTDNSSDPTLTPTRENMLQQMREFFRYNRSYQTCR